MKLKERLAEKYSWDIHTGGSDGKLERAFLAGFEKAKQEALKFAFAFDDHTVANWIEIIGEENVD